MRTPSWRASWLALQTFPWIGTARTLQDRFREDRLGLNASSLTFTTVISLVPLFTVLLAVFSAFPVFGKLQGVMQQWLADSLFPESISRQVMGYLTQFAAKASRVGMIGFGFLLLTALSLVLTIDRTLNGIWRVRRRRPLAQRVLTYWAVLTLGPLALAASLATSSYALSASRGLVGSLPSGLGFGLDLAEFALVSAGVGALYRFVPNTQVRWAHAGAGGVFVSLGLELAKKALAWYVSLMPGFSLIYGAFATVPILLLWIYIVWLLLLFGAVIAAYLPSLLGGVSRPGEPAGWRFELALETVAVLDRARRDGRGGLDTEALARELRVGSLQLEPVMDVLVRLGWAGTLEDGREVLLVDPPATSAAPLVDAVLLADGPGATRFKTRAGLPGLRLADLLPAV